MYKKTLSLDDVLLEPRFSSINSRSEIDISTELSLDLLLELPIVSSPMDTVTGPEMAVEMSRAGGLGILHRYASIEEQIKWVDYCVKKGCQVGAAVGVSGDFLDRAQASYYAGAKALCIDVAHGHHTKVRDAIKAIRDTLGDEPHIMAGNVATAEAFRDLSEWGANSIRVGIGGGCFTAGTLVRTTDGDKPIEDVQVGDKVYTHTGDVQPVVDTLSFDRDEEIIVINGIESTTNHEYYVVNKTDVELINDDNLGDFAYWVEAEHLDKSRHLLVELA
jgi:IMP dehydrogenase/GMP reductase